MELVGVQEKVPVGNVSEVEVNVAPGMLLFQVILNIWPASASLELMVKFSGVPGQTTV